VLHRIPLALLSLLASLALLWLAPPPLQAQTRGGGSKTTDCLTEFAASTPVNSPAKKPKKISCVDNDPSCDADPAQGSCTFMVAVCANVTDPALPQCGPEELDEYRVDNVQPDEDPRHDFDFQALEDLMNATVFPAGAAQTDRCSTQVGIRLPLPVRIGKGKAKYGKAKKLLRTEAETRRGVVDGDKLQMQCAPIKGASPCDGITSTFDQIQKHVFDQSCGRDTCHNAAQPLHELSLAPGASHAALVGAAPFNFAAAGAGKLRVDPGDPDNSFLLDKLRGKLGDLEGERMPFEMRRLKKAHVRLVEDWIAAGAPTAGFVSPQGCPAP
jgi:hypothetical protein